MQKLMKKWVFTLVISVILLAFGIIMLTPLGVQAMNIMIAAALAVYMVLVLADNVIHYGGVLRIFAVLELLIVAVLIVGLIVEEYRIIPVNGISGRLGLIMWLRAFVEVLHGYYLQEKVGFERANATDGNKGRAERFGLVKMLMCIFFLSLGVALICTNFENVDLYIRCSVAVVSLLLGVATSFITYQNRAGTRGGRKQANSGANDNSAPIDSQGVVRENASGTTAENSTDIGENNTTVDGNAAGAAGSVPDGYEFDSDL